jgi:hypothetical protein
MAKVNTPPDELAPDAFEADLVAYLDGELDTAAARRVEARLARDPAARARAAELKKSFEMLEFLPKPEPSPNFTSRTLDKLPAVQATGATPSPSGTRPAQAAPSPSGSTSVPVPLELDDEPAAEDSPTPQLAPRALLPGAILIVCALLGYLLTGALRPNRDKETMEGPIEVEPRVIEYLPLLAIADDLKFVEELAKPEFFGSDPAVRYDSGLKIPHAEVPDKSASELDSLTKSFRALPAARRAEIVKLDGDLHILDTLTRDRCFRSLEAYGVWMKHLQETERHAVLGAATGAERLEIIRGIRELQWLDSLPATIRGKPEKIKEWRDEENARRDQLAFLHRRAESFAAHRTPWPFDTEDGRQKVVEFARETFKPEETKKSRLSAEELSEYRRALETAKTEGAWGMYGLLVYFLANHHPYLPEPADPKLMYLEVADLPAAVSSHLTRKGLGGATTVSAALRPEIGRWPEFPLEAHRELGRVKFAAKLPQLGPARLEELKPAVKAFAEQVLFPKLTRGEKSDLTNLQGRWPEYPQRLMYYSHKYDLPVPGVTLPFSPKKWEEIYGPRAVQTK